MKNTTALDRRTSLLTLGVVAVIEDHVTRSGTTLEAFAQAHNLPLAGLQTGDLGMADLWRTTVALKVDLVDFFVEADVDIQCPAWCTDHVLEMRRGRLLVNIHRATVGDSPFGEISVNVDINDDGSASNGPYAYVPDDRSDGTYTVDGLREFATSLAAAADVLEQIAQDVR